MTSRLSIPIEILSRVIGYAIDDVPRKKTDRSYRTRRPRSRGQLVNGNSLILHRLYKLNFTGLSETNRITVPGRCLPVEYYNISNNTVCAGKPGRATERYGR